MVKTRDGHKLKIGERYTVVSLDDDTQNIESTISCVYWGSWVRNNTQFLDCEGSSCSGCLIPPTTTLHRFTPADDKDIELLEHDVGELVIKHRSAIESVVVRRLK